MTYTPFDVEVPGGTLHVGRWGGGDTVLLAAHGITSTHRSMLALADALGEGVTVIAPDLRGRGQSREITGPFGLTYHADDIVAVLEHLGLERVVVLGHSMGAFVTVVLAHRYPDRVARTVLVDGGLPLDMPAMEGVSIEELTRAVIGPSLDRLRMTFESMEAYFEFWKAHPAFVGEWSTYAEDAYAYDLIGQPPELRSGVNELAVLGDAESQFATDDLARAIDGLAHPSLLIRAPRGLFNQVPPLYPDEWTQQWQAKLPSLRETLVDDVNHFTILVGERGASKVAELVRGELNEATSA